ncbi:MAG TPA: LacI family DNA-binding transcriptional regulator [Anaerolineales bacterium]
MIFDSPRTKRKVTMRDVARAANVSQSTVSRILNPNSAKSKVPISEETIEKVLAVVKELGYQPNQYARSLRGQKNHVIAMLIGDIGNPFYHPMVRAVQDVAFQYHYSVMVANSDHLREKEMLFCESLLRRPVDGAIIVPWHMTDDDLRNLIDRTGMAVSVLGSHMQLPGVDIVYADDTKASYDVVQWLIEQRGHQRIAMICANQEFHVIKRRQGAFRQAMADAGLTVPSEYVVEGDWSFESGRQAIATLLALHEPPTAVFAANDSIAIGALDAAEKMNYRVPEDIAIIGFDDIPAASWVRPQLSTVAQYPDQMGTLLANALFDRIQNKYNGPGRCFEVPCHFFERASA